MRIAARTHDYGRQPVEQLAPLLRKEGLSAAQLVLPRAFTDIEGYNEVTMELLDTIRNSFTEHDVSISILGCYMDLGNPDDAVRKTAIDTFCQCLNYAKILGAHMVGTETAYPRLSKEEKAKWHPYMMDSLTQLVNAAEKADMQMAIEPVYWHPLEDLATTMDVFHTFNSNHLQMIFDPANVLEFPDIDQAAYWQTWFKALGDKISALHMKDFVLGKKGEYIPVPLGEGVMQYDEIFKYLKANHPDITIIREELDPKTAAQDIAYIQTYWDKT